jgi:Phosphoesterase family
VARPCDGNRSIAPPRLLPSDGHSRLDFRCRSVQRCYFSTKISLGCPTPAAPDKTCSGSGALTLDNFFNAAYQENYGCTDSLFQEIAGQYDGSQSTSVLWNYWTIAKNFMLQDRMFMSVPSYSKISHLFMVSGWSSTCTAQPCSASQENYQEVGDTTQVYGWKDIANALSTTGHTWKYYKGEDWDPSLCGSCSGGNTTCLCYKQPSSCFNTTTPTGMVWFWNPLANFSDFTSQQKQQITTLQTFLTDVTTESTFPQVSWIVPSIASSEHAGSFTNTDPVSGKGYNAPNVDLKRGQAYVTMLLQQIMKNTALWNSSVVFLAWDDWGGFYDHVRPPTDSSGNLMYGLRVPGMTISPWLGINKLDHQTLSFDAYLAFIENLLLPIGPGMPGQPLNGDGRPDVREWEPALGNLVDEFDFNQNPAGTTRVARSGRAAA